MTICVWCLSFNSANKHPTRKHVAVNLHSQMQTCLSFYITLASVANPNSNNGNNSHQHKDAVRGDQFIANSKYREKVTGSPCKCYEKSCTQNKQPSMIFNARTSWLPNARTYYIKQLWGNWITIKIIIMGKWDSHKNLNYQQALQHTRQRYDQLQCFQQTWMWNYDSEMYLVTTVKQLSYCDVCIPLCTQYPL